MMDQLNFLYSKSNINHFIANFFLHKNLTRKICCGHCAYKPDLLFQKPSCYKQ